MQASQLVPASELARNLGVKCIVYGDPGVGKTPVVATAPRPVLCACEPGMRSMSKLPTPTWEAYTLPRVAEFFEWACNSHEATNYDTIAFDSVSQFAEMLLAHELKVNKDPRKAYGQMANYVYAEMVRLYFLQRKHVYIIAKKTLIEEGNRKQARPYFPGQELNVRIPHLFDEILHMEKVLSPQTGKYVPAFRTVGNDAILARDRSGQLAEFEYPDLNNLFNKAMQ